MLTPEGAIPQGNLEQRGKVKAVWTFITLLTHHPQPHSYSREALLFHNKHKELGNWGGRQLGFVYPLQTLQQAQIHIHLLNPTPASHGRPH